MSGAACDSHRQPIPEYAAGIADTAWANRLFLFPW